MTLQVRLESGRSVPSLVWNDFGAYTCRRLRFVQSETAQDLTPADEERMLPGNHAPARGTTCAEESRRIQHQPLLLLGCSGGFMVEIRGFGVTGGCDCVGFGDLAVEAIS
jgi:hypothetical protein